MYFKKNILITTMIAFVLFVLIFGTVQAADWPSRTITANIHASAGGGTDTLFRMVFPYVEKILGQKIIIINKPGGHGEVLWTETAHDMKPDGYNWTSVYSPGTQGYTVIRETNYSIDDFSPCCSMVTDPGVLVVRADSEFKTFQDFIDYAKENPGILTVGNTGTGSDDHIATLFIEKQCDIKVTHVPFEGSAPNISALLGGHISAAAINASEATPYVNSGKARVLGVMEEERFEFLPNVPTFREQGYDIISGSTRGFVAPKGTPEEIINKMADAVKQTLQNPEFIEKAVKVYQPLRYRGPKEFTELLYKVQEQIREMNEESPF